MKIFRDMFDNGSLTLISVIMIMIMIDSGNYEISRDKYLSRSKRFLIKSENHLIFSLTYDFNYVYMRKKFFISFYDKFRLLKMKQLIYIGQWST